jgi:hypothetical protein
VWGIVSVGLTTAITAELQKSALMMRVEISLPKRKRLGGMLLDLL